QDRIEWNVPIARHPCDQSSQAKGQARVSVVEPDDDLSPGAGKARDPSKASKRVRQMMKHAGRIDDIECIIPEARLQKVGLDELHPRHVETSSRLCGELQRRPGDVRTYHDTFGAGQIEAHLAGAAADFHNTRVTRN